MECLTFLQELPSLKRQAARGNERKLKGGLSGGENYNGPLLAAFHGVTAQHLHDCGSGAAMGGKLLFCLKFIKAHNFQERSHFGRVRIFGKMPATTITLVIGTLLHGNQLAATQRWFATRKSREWSTARLYDARHTAILSELLEQRCPIGDREQRRRKRVTYLAYIMPTRFATENPGIRAIATAH
jgi:hypothetical protein